MEADTRNGAWLECQYSPPTNEKMNMGHLPPNTPSFVCMYTFMSEEGARSHHIHITNSLPIHVSNPKAVDERAL